MAEGNPDAVAIAQRLQHIAAVMVCLAGMGPDALLVESFHHLFGRHAVDDNGHKAFPRRIVGTGQNLDMRHVAKSRQVASSVDHGIGQMGLIGVNGDACRLDPLTCVVAVRQLAAKPVKIGDHIRHGGI